MEKKRPVRDPLLPLTHYQRLSKKQPTSRRHYALWITVLFVVLFLGTGGFYLQREIEALKKDVKITPLPTAPVEAVEAPKTISPTVTQAKEGDFCGGIAATQCADGYTCKLDGKYPDAGGKCVANTKTSQPSVIPTMSMQSTQAPVSQAPDAGQTMCTMDAMQCPNGAWVGRSGPNCEFKCSQ